MGTRRRAVCPIILSGMVAVACTPAPTPGTLQPAGGAANGRAASETVTVRDPQLEQRIARLELRLLERDAQLEDLQARLDEARREVVRAMAKLQTLASRAEAASAMAEAEIALQSLKTAVTPQAAPEIGQAAQLLQQSTAEFDKRNYGGALYLANQAKSVVGASRERVASGVRGSLRPGEVLFALPLRLETVSRSNVRDGPGAGYAVVFTLETGAPVIGYSYADQWVRVGDDAGRSGWIFQTLIGRRQGR
jgi:uncharacterized coiled-coil protein SlyX